jgi:uncharacterized protein YfaA (DUF2138 family)
MRVFGSRPLRRALYAVTVIVIVIAGYFGWNAWQRRLRLAAPIPATLLDIAPIRLAQPDAMIVSSRVRDLPRDLLSVPLLKSALTEDFVFYYEGNDRLLSLKGALRRIAYEHDLSLGDEVIAMALDRPADIALWRDENGKLTHWLINAERTEWTKLLQWAATAAADDKQLSQFGTLPLADGASTPVYQLFYAPGQSLLFAGNGDKMVIFSDSTMLNTAYGDDAARAKVWQALLDSHWQASPLRQHFGLSTFTGKHTVVAELAYLSFNYQNFFPAFEALRFDFDGKDWDSYVRLNGGTPREALETEALWKHVPTAASLCASLPVDAQKLGPIFKDKGSALNDNASVLDGVHAPAAICWYPDGGLYSPLVVARVDAKSTTDAALDALFDAAIGNSLAAASASQPVVTGVAAPAAGGASPAKDAARTWHRSVATDFGRFDVTMARQGDWLVFSPKAQLVENALAVFAGLRPAMADTLPDSPMVQAVLTPRTLATLLDQAALGSLPQKSEPILRAAAQNQLSPRIKAMGAFPPVALMLRQPLSDSTRAWQPIQWQTLNDAR